MAANSSDMFMKVGRATATTLSAPGYTVGNTTINVASTTNYPTDTGVFVAVDEVDSSGERISGSYNVFRGVVSSATQISSLVYQGGDANRNYSAGATTRVYIVVSSYQMNRLIDGLLVAHNQDGTIKPQTDLSLITPKITTSLNDTNGNELIKITPTASAVNELSVTNAATGNAPVLGASGGDTNIDLNLIPKGTGNVQKNGRNIDWWEEVGRTTLTSVGSTITITGVPARKYLKIIGNLVDNGSAITGTMTFNNDSTANYAQTNSTAGAADGSLASQNSLVVAVDSAATPRIFEMEVVNNTAKEKLFQGHAMSQGAAGAATVPIRREINGKWANTSTQITRVDVQTSTANNFAVGSEVIVLGHD